MPESVWCGVRLQHRLALPGEAYGTFERVRVYVACVCVFVQAPLLARVRADGMLAQPLALMRVV